MKYSFQTSAPREHTNAEKYMLREKLFGTEDVMPVWVADMDIDTPDFVLEAVKKRLEHPIIGYEEFPISAFEAQCEWMQKHHGVVLRAEDMFYSPSVVASINVAIEAFSEVGDKIIVQTPVYSPFFHSIINHERKVLKNPLKIDEDGRYSFDIEDLKSKIDEDTKLLLLCSPHNPVGRVWKQEELQAILDICIEYDIIVFADEIHSDLVYAPNKHLPFLSLGDEAKKRTVTAMGVGKTFNMAGFAISSVVIEDESLRKRFQKVYDTIHFAQGSALSHVAYEAAYKNGDAWLQELKLHLQENMQMLQNVCEKYSHIIKLANVEATYLAWLDCREMRLSDKELRVFFVEEAKLGLNPGLSFGREGSGFMRLNFALSSAKMLELIQRLENALEKKFKRI